MQTPRYIQIFSRIVCLIVFTTVARLSAAAPVDALIIVPDVTGPAKAIYDHVISGVQSVNTLDTAVIRIKNKTSAKALLKQISAHDADLVIPIGNSSYKLCSEITRKGYSSATFVAGGISGKPNGIPTLSLTADSLTTLLELKRYAPQVTHLRLVYNDQFNGWWYQQAVEAAKTLDIEVIGYHARTIKDGVKLYNQLLNDAHSETSAVWLPLKGIVPSKTILPLVLERAWAKKLPVVSNNPSHARLGGLMALYPDHARMGKQLAEFAYSHHTNSGATLIAGNKEIRKAINIRTSAHVGLRVDDEQLKAFDKVFPAMR